MSFAAKRDEHPRAAYAVLGLVGVASAAGVVYFGQLAVKGNDAHTSRDRGIVLLFLLLAVFAFYEIYQTYQRANVTKKVQ